MKSMSFAQGIDQLINELGLKTVHPPKVVAEAERLPEVIPAAELKERVDLRKELIVTIDGKKARDFDDAVTVRRVGKNYLLKVSIADVGYYVSPGSSLDQEAYDRATSVYFPQRVLPMLPEKISNQLCSLVPNEDRLTVTAEMEFDPTGKKLRQSFYRSVIRSRARLTYESAQEMIDASKNGEPSTMLQRMKELALTLRQKRIERGSLDFDLPEPEIIMDLEEETIEQIVKSPRYFSHRLIEEFMIAANEAVAEFLTEQKRPMVYRVHDRPLPEKAEEFRLLLHNLGYFTKPLKSGLDFAQVLARIRGKPEEKLINTFLLRTMSQARYDVKNSGHFGLASSCYTHFTSPIRRYPDLIVHRALVQALAKSAARRAGLEPAAEHCSLKERLSMKAEWASRDLAGGFFLKDHIGEEYDGIVSGISKTGLFVELIPFFVEGRLSLRHLTDDYYVVHRSNHEVVGRRRKKRIRIGDRLRVVVEKVDLQKRWVDFCMAKKVPGSQFA